jgi:hypothetical protein
VCDVLLVLYLDLLIFFFFSKLVLVREGSLSAHYLLEASQEQDLIDTAPEGVKVRVIDWKVSDYRDPDGFLYIDNDPPLSKGEEDEWAKLRDWSKSGSTVDPLRGSFKADFGYCGPHNPERKEDSLGLARPALLDGTHHAWVKNIFLEMTKYARYAMEKWPGLQLYSDEERNKLVAELIAKGCIVEALAISLFDSRARELCLRQLLCVHFDRHNSLWKNYAWLMSRIHWFYNELTKSAMRQGKHAYAKKGNDDYIAKRLAYGPLIEYMKEKVATTIPASVMTVTADNLALVRNKVTSSPHLEKMALFYNTLSDPIERFVSTHWLRDGALECFGGLILCARLTSHKVEWFYNWMSEICLDPL